MKPPVIAVVLQAGLQVLRHLQVPGLPADALFVIQRIDGRGEIILVDRQRVLEKLPGQFPPPAALQNHAKMIQCARVVGSQVLGISLRIIQKPRIVPNRVFGPKLEGDVQGLGRHGGNAKLFRSIHDEPGGHAHRHLVIHFKKLSEAVLQIIHRQLLIERIKHLKLGHRVVGMKGIGEIQLRPDLAMLTLQGIEVHLPLHSLGVDEYRLMLPGTVGMGCLGQ